MACKPTDPCYSCPDCAITEPTPVPCPTPTYTTEGCVDGTRNGTCIIIDNDTENCVGIVKNQTTLKSFISKLLIYIKKFKIFSNTDNSIKITPITDSCNDKADIKVNISPNANNQLQLLTNGLFVSTSPVNIVPGANSCVIITPNTVGNQTTYTISLDTTCLAALLCPLCTTATATCLPPTNLTVTN